MFYISPFIRYGHADGLRQTAAVAETLQTALFFFWEGFALPLLLFIKTSLLPAVVFSLFFYLNLAQSSVYVAEAMEARLVVVESCAHIPMDEKSEVCIRDTCMPR